MQYKTRIFYLVIQTCIDVQSTNLNNALIISTDKDHSPRIMEKYVAFRTVEKNASTEKATIRENKNRITDALS